MESTFVHSALLIDISIKSLIYSGKIKIYSYLCSSRPARQTYFLESVFFLDGELRQLIMVGMTSAHFGMYYVQKTYTAKV